MRVSTAVVCTTLAAVVFGASRASAQSTSSPASGDGTHTSDGSGGDPPTGFTLPNSDRLRFMIDFMAGYGSDRANASLGLERQGRVGYVVFTALGKLNSRVSYLVSVNPVDETQPRPACGVAGFFYPNSPTFLYGAATDISCDSSFGNRRVDPYREVALDLVPQQGPIREAWVRARLTTNSTIEAGRMRMPIGFDWEEAGSFTAKDATEIQRINTQANFGLTLDYKQPAKGRSEPWFEASATADLGDTNRWWDYDYYYFEDGSFGTNSQLTMLLSGRVSPFHMLEVRSSFQYGDTGSKVERLPSYWASKRNDNAFNIGAEVRPTSFSRLIVERASYTWGPRPSSALMLDVSPDPIHKRGYYTTAEAWLPVTQAIKAGANVSYERIDRADSLIRFLAAQKLDDVTMGKHDEMTVLRTYVDFGHGMRIGFYRNLVHNPYPWVSGISTVTGPKAFSQADTDKWGLVVRMQVR
jgi:hypothetical protein